MEELTDATKWTERLGTIPACEFSRYRTDYNPNCQDRDERGEGW